MAIHTIKKYLNIIFLCAVLPVSSQNKKLEVGDRAPDIKVFSWYKGEPVAHLAEGKVYVVEFGATWCKPCIESIPHIKELAKEYRGEAQVISFFVMEENTQSSDTQKPKYVQKVERFLEKWGNGINYLVGVDTPDDFMEEHWMKAAMEIPNIPYAFIIDKEGYVAWHGQSTVSNLSELKKALDHILSAKYDIKEAIKENKMKKDVEVRANQVFSDSMVVREDGLMFKSVLKKTKYSVSVDQSPYFPSRFWYDNTLADSLRVKPGKAKWFNMSPLDMYGIAYGDTLRNDVPVSRNMLKDFRWNDELNPYLKTLYGQSWPIPILEVENQSFFLSRTKGGDDSKSSGNRYHYSIQIPEERATALFLQQVMQADLKNYFGYEATVEYRDMPVWELHADPKSFGLLSAKKPIGNYEFIYGNDGSFKFNNADVKDLIAFLGIWYGIKDSYGDIDLEDQIPFVDATGIDFKIAFEISKNSQSSFEAIADYLRSKGISLKKSFKRMKVIVIRPDK